MADEHTIPPYAPQKDSGAQALQAAVHRLTTAIEASRKPEMPLGVLASATRDAPLGALLCAFLLGIAWLVDADCVPLMHPSTRCPSPAGENDMRSQT